MSAPLAALAALQERFRTRLVGRVEELERLIDAMAAGDPAARDQLTLGFHSLAGIGGTYGYPDISSFARRGETLCRNGAPPAPRLRKLVEQIALCGAAPAPVAFPLPQPKIA